MARQEDGWPLGLQLLNVRLGLPPRDYFGSISFNTALTNSSTSSTDSSSDLDSESTGSLIQERSITLGSLIGAASILDLSRRSLRGRSSAADNPSKPKKTCKCRTWFFSSLCSKDSTEVKNVENPPSLGQFLAVERRSSTNNGNLCGRSRNQDGYLVPDEMSLALHLAPNSLFLNGEIAPPRLHSSTS